MKNLKSEISDIKCRQRRTGTREWAQTTINIQRGCEHGCRYCYAKYNAVHRFHKCMAQAWSRPVIDNSKVDRNYGKYRGVVMFPSAHDITPVNINECMIVIRKLLDAGNQLLIVSKPHFECITLICETFKEFRRQITFRFTIGSIKDEVLEFWEPRAPNFAERIACLHYAFEAGYATSISCEPYLDPYPLYVYEACHNWLTDSFWVGLLRNFDARVDLHGVPAELIERFVKPLKIAQSPVCVAGYVRMLKDRPYIKFKDSIRDVVTKEIIEKHSTEVRSQESESKNEQKTNRP